MAQIVAEVLFILVIEVEDVQLGLVIKGVVRLGQAVHPGRFDQTHAGKRCQRFELLGGGPDDQILGCLFQEREFGDDTGRLFLVNAISVHSHTHTAPIQPVGLLCDPWVINRQKFIGSNFDPVEPIKERRHSLDFGPNGFQADRRKDAIGGARGKAKGWQFPDAAFLHVNAEQAEIPALDVRIIGQSIVQRELARVPQPWRRVGDPAHYGFELVLVVLEIDFGLRRDCADV